jgi:hypothetical protein
LALGITKIGKLNLNDQEFQAFTKNAMAELQAKQQSLQDDFNLGEWPRWALDQETELLQFFDENDRVALEGSFMHIGSYSPKSESWKWAWSNQSVSPTLREKALPLKQLKAITGFELFEFEGTFEVDEYMAWELAAMAVQLLGAVGCYRAPSADDGPTSFLAIKELRNVQYPH